MTRWFYTLRLWFRSLLRRSHVEQELSEELYFHLEKLIEERVAAGLTIRQARDEALRELGGLDQIKEACRDTRRVNWIESFVQDIRYGLRQLRRNPGFTATAILTLGLGVGANAALFSVANTLFLRPLPVPDAGQLVVLAAREKGAPSPSDVSYQDFVDYSNGRTTFAAMAGYELGLDGLAAEGWAERTVTCYVTGSYFPMLRLRPALGRLFRPEEGTTRGADPVIVLDYSFWQRRFAGDPQVLGKAVRVNGRPMTVIGVTPSQFHGTKAWVKTDAYLPISQMTQEGDAFWTSRAARGHGGFTVLARLGDGVAVRRARASLDVMARQLARQYPETNRNISIEVYPEPLARPQADAVEAAPPIVAAFLLLGLVVLVVACVNLVNLIESRALARAGEMAIRYALGAGRGRLARQCVTESVLLAWPGAVAGLALAMWISRPLSSICTPVDVSIFQPDFQPDWRVFVYALAIALLAGVLVGVVPARRAWRSNLNTAMQEAGRSLSGARRHQRARNALVVAQVASSTVLLVAAGLFIRSLSAVKNANLGFDPRGVLNLGMDVAELGYGEAQGRSFHQELLERVRALPGVESAACVYSTPFYHDRLGASVYIEGRPLPAGQRPPAVFHNVASPSIFSTLRIPILRGRDFARADSAASRPVAVISQAMARRFWPGQDAVGRRFATAGPQGPWIEVIGISGDTQFVGPTTPRTEPYFFLPLAQSYKSAVTLQVRTAVPPAALAHEVERRVHALAPGLSVFDLRTQEEALNGATGFFLFRLGAGVAAGLGVLGLLLTMAGVYGVVSYHARLRSHEMGLRMALGARREDILKLVVGQGARSALLGIGIGIVGALISTRFLAGLLYGVKPSDPLTLIAVSMVLTSVVLLASYIPARRVTRADPLAALKSE